MQHMRFYDTNEAAKARKHGITVKKLIGGYRRVVPSPEPRYIMQTKLIKELLKENKIVIACGCLVLVYHSIYISQFSFGP